MARAERYCSHTMMPRQPIQKISAVTKAVDCEAVLPRTPWRVQSVPGRASHGSDWPAAGARAGDSQ
eukprot:284105-Hanusia_phi.AAC.1